MSRPKGYADAEARTAFTKEIEKGMIDLNIRSKGELAERMGLAERTGYRRFNNLNELRLSDLISIVRIIKPKPGIVLRLLGYQPKDIKRALEDTVS